MPRYLKLFLLFTLATLSSCEDEFKQWVGIEDEPVTLSFTTDSSLQFPEQSQQQIQFTASLLEGDDIPPYQISWQLLDGEGLELPILSTEANEAQLTVSFQTPDVDRDQQLTLEVTFSYSSADKTKNTKSRFDLSILANPELVINGSARGFTSSTVNVTAGDRMFTGMTDSNGGFILEIELADLTQWVTVEVANEDSKNRAVSILGSGEYLIQQAGGDGVINESDLPELVLTPASTSRYVQVMALAEFYQQFQTQAQLLRYRQQIDLPHWLMTAQVLYGLNKQAGLSLPDGVNNNIELVKDKTSINSLVESWQQQSPDSWQQVQRDFLAEFRLKQDDYDLFAEGNWLFSGSDNYQSVPVGQLLTQLDNTGEYQIAGDKLSWSKLTVDNGLWQVMFDEAVAWPDTIEGHWLSQITFEFLPVWSEQAALLTMYTYSPQGDDASQIAQKQQSLFYSTEVGKTLAWSATELTSTDWLLELPSHILGGEEQSTQVVSVTFSLDGTGQINAIGTGQESKSFRWLLDQELVQIAGQNASLQQYLINLYQTNTSPDDKTLVLENRLTSGAQTTSIQFGRMKSYDSMADIQLPAGRYHILSAPGQLSEDYFELTTTADGIYSLGGQTYVMSWQQQGNTTRLLVYQDSACQVDGCPLLMDIQLLTVAQVGQDWLFVAASQEVDPQPLDLTQLDPTQKRQISSRWLYTRMTP